MVRAAAGQTLTVTLKPSNPQNYFSVIPPVSDLAMYVGQTADNFTGVLPTDGDYTVRAYLMRSAARRNESSHYTLAVAVTGKPLPPLPASKGVLLPGTPFHALAQIPCMPAFDPEPQQCEAFVIHRGLDGTATVEVHGSGNLQRRILFVQGKPIAADATDPLTFSRQGDLAIVKIGAAERYEIPDALLTGG